MRKAFEIFSLVNFHERKIIEKYERFLSRTYCFYKVKFDDQINSKFDVKRFTIICTMKLCSLIFLIRCVLWPTPLIKYWTCNAYHYLGNAFMINLAMCCATLSANFGNGLCILGYSMVNKQCFLVYFDKFKYKKLQYSLNDHYRRRFLRRLDMFTNLLNIIHIPTLINWSCLICGPIIVGYFDPSVQFSIIGETGFQNF